MGGTPWSRPLIKVARSRERKMDSKAHILVVDDNRSIVRLIEALLHKEGFETLTAFDGLEGLEKAQEEKPDLVILDIVMPKMDGYEVSRILQSNPDTAAIPVLMLTIKGQVDDSTLDKGALETAIQERMEGYEAGAIEFLSKPIKAKELLNRVKTLLWFDRLPIVEEDLQSDRWEPEQSPLPQEDWVRREERWKGDR